MAEYDGDIKLSVSLKPTDVKKSAEGLKRAVEGVFDSTKGKEVSKPIEKLQVALDKAVNRAEALSQKMTDLERQVPTNKYIELQKEVDKVTQEYMKQKKVVDDMRAAGTLDTSFGRQQQQELDEISAKYKALIEQKQQLVASGQAFNLEITDPDKYEALKTKLSEVNNQTVSLLNTYGQLTGQEETVNQVTAQYAQVLNTIAQNANVANEEIIKLVQQQEELETQLESLNAKKDLLEQAGVGLGYEEFDNTVHKIAEVEAELENVTAQVEQYKEELSTLPQPEVPLTFKDFIRDLGHNLQFVGSTAREAFTSFVDGAVNAASTLKGKLSSALNRVSGLIKKTFNGNSIKRGFMTVLRYTLGIRSLYILVNKIRNAVKQAINNMAQWNDGNNAVNDSMTRITSSLTTFKNSIGVAVAPLLNLLAPALEMIIDLATQAANAIGRFFAALTGASTVMQATKTQKDYAKSLGGTASGSSKAKKETDKLLASFDDLNVLGKENEDTSGGGGGGGSSSGIQDMFTEIETPFSNLAEKLKEAITSGDFSSIGQAIGGKIRDAVNSIDWEDIKEKMSTGISSVTSFLNGLLTTEGLFSSLGENAAEGINTFVSGIHQFIEEIDWKEILHGIGEGITSFLSTIDLGEILLTIGDGIVAALEGLSGFLDGLDLKSILDNLWEGIKTAVTEFEWSSLFKGIGSLLGESAELVVELVEWLAEAFTDLLINMHDYMWPYVEPYLEDLPEDAGFLDIGLAIIQGITDGLLDGLKDIGTWLYDNVFKPIYDGICEAFDINSPSKVMEEVGGYLVEGLMNAITTIPDEVMEVFEDLKTKLVETWTAIKTKATFMWTMFKLGLVTIVNAIKKAVTTPFTDMKDTIVETVTSLKTKVVALWKGLWTGIKGVINSILGGVESFCNGIIDGINNVLDALDIVDNLPDTVKEYLELDDFTIPKLEHVEIPRLAQGAVIPPNKKFLAMLGDQTSGTNIEAPLDTIVDAFRQAMGSMQGVGSSPTVVNLHIDGQTFARLTVPYEVKELSRLGYNVKVMEG